MFSQNIESDRQSHRSNLGFGLERIGIAALRFPRIATVLLLVSLVFSVLAIPKIRFDGNVINVIDQQSEAYINYHFQNQNFRNFTGDVWLIIKTPRLNTAAGLEELRQLHLDLALEDNVKNVFSIFSLGDISGGLDNFKPLVPDELQDDRQAVETLKLILEKQPAAAAILAADKNAIMLVVSLEVDGPLSEDGLSGILNNIRAGAKKLSPADFEIMMSGYPAIRTSIVEAIISDQTVLTIAGILIGAIVALLVFRNLASAFICTIPPMIAVSWILATFAISGVKLNFLTTVLPTLVLIISFADAIVIYFRWQALNRQSSDTIANLEEALWRVGPASSLTSITTALAFLSFAFASSATMTDFAFFGVAAVMLAFLAVIVSLPLACYWASKIVALKSTGRGPAFQKFGQYVADRVLQKPRVVIGTSLLALVALVAVHLQLEPSYETTSHLPYNSEIKAAEAFSDATFSGTSQILIIVPVSPGGLFYDAENRQRLAAVNDIASRLFGVGRVLSLDGIWATAEPDKIEQLGKDMLASQDETRGRFLSYDGRSMMVIARASARANTKLINRDVARLKTALAPLDFSSEIRITGLPVLLASEFPRLINQLRTGLLLAIILAVGVIGLAAKSLPLAAATLVPNLLPLLFAEAVIWLSGSNLDITNIIALTIAFGIAIDNAVHVINSFKIQLQQKFEPRTAMKRALVEISPALLASTVIVCVASVITQFSAMPSINVLGRLMVVTLIMALFSNLVVLPSYLLLFHRQQADQTKTDEQS